MADNTALRLTLFLSVFAIMAIAEYCFPARLAKIQRSIRWRTNFLMMISGALLAKIVVPIGLVGIAFWVNEQQLGLMNITNATTIFSVITCLLLLDILIYWQHRLFHTMPILWRLHKVHHADSHVDTTSGLRFHPVEILLSLLVKAFAIITLGVPVIAVIIFEVLLNAFAIFNHANIRLPKAVDTFLSYIIITQRLHRIHHSQRVNETNSNYGFSVSWWDRIFGSFLSEANQPDENLTLGLKAYPATENNSRLLTLLKIPFKKIK